jgi:hypothetical protein
MRRRPLELLGIASLATCLATVALTGVAVAQIYVPTQFGISPARRDVVDRPPLTLLPTDVFNTTNVPYSVKVFPVLLGQDITGAFTFQEIPRDLSGALDILTPTPSSFTLHPDESREVQLRWNYLPLGERVAYIGVVFQGTPQLPGARAISIIARLLSVNFFRLPGHYRIAGRFTALNATQFAVRVLRFLPRVKNVGDAIGTPQSGRLTIRDASYKSVFQVPWTGHVILPGVQSDFPVDVRQILPAGHYTVTASMDFGSRRGQAISRSFTLIGPNELPSPNLAVDNFNAMGTIGDPAHLSVRVASTGSAPVSVAFEAKIYHLYGSVADNRPDASKRISLSTLPPGGHRELDEALGKLSRGSYRATISYLDPTGAPQMLVSDFVAATKKSLWQRVVDFLDRHKVILILIAVVVVALLLLFVVWRRQRHLQEELRAARAGYMPSYLPDSDVRHGEDVGRR